MIWPAGVDGTSGANYNRLHCKVFIFLESTKTPPMKASIVTTKQCKRHCGLRFAAAVAASATVKIAQITHMEVQINETSRFGVFH